MKILLFGATGMVGQHIIDRAIAHGHQVRAFGRNVFEKLSTERKNLELFKGYLFSEGDIKDAVKGVDAVLSAIGGPSDGINKSRSLGMKKIVGVLGKKGPRRIIGIGGLGILQADEEKMIYETPDFPKKYLPVTEEHLTAYRLLSASGLDWTFVCPPVILDAGPSQSYQVKADYPAEGRQEISAGDIAEFMMKELKDGQFTGHRVGIASV